MLRLATLTACCLALGACGSSPAVVPQTGPDGLTVGDQNAMREIGLTAELSRETARTTRALLVTPELERQALEVRLDAELFRARTDVERAERETRELRDPALVRGMRKVIRILRDRNQQLTLAGAARLADDPEGVLAAASRAGELGTQADQTLGRLQDRFDSLSR